MQSAQDERDKETLAIRSNPKFVSSLPNAHQYCPLIQKGGVIRQAELQRGADISGRNSARSKRCSHGNKEAVWDGHMRQPSGELQGCEERAYGMRGEVGAGQ